MTKAGVTVTLLLLVAFMPTTCREAEVRIGSKKFTESVILGEALGELARSAGRRTIHFQELGGTRLVFNALVDGAIDAYPEYVGTITEEILAGEDVGTPERLQRALAARGVVMSRPLGFNNTYALGLLRARAAALGVTKISDLGRHPRLRLGLTAEFMERGDGWPALRKKYALPHTDVRGLDHDIAYRQLTAGTIDVLDVYTTDAKIKKLDLAILEDDANFFPRYDCVILYRQDLAERFPRVVEQIKKMGASLDERRMIEMNYRSEMIPMPENAVAREYVAGLPGVTLADQAQTGSTAGRIAGRTLEHLDLVRKSLIPAILFGIAFGILAFRWRRLGAAILAAVGIVQTVPALALLVLVMPLVTALGMPSLGVGSVTAIVALFLYALLPIVMGTFTGLSGIEAQYTETARALGFSARYRLWKIELPLAAHNIMKGVETAAVINVGFATLGALIGAGGYGQPILTGIRRDDFGSILEGAIPAALLAVAVHFAFHCAERWFVPRGLRIRPGQ